MRSARRPCSRFTLVRTMPTMPTTIACPHCFARPSRSRRCLKTSDPCSSPKQCNTRCRQFADAHVRAGEELLKAGHILPGTPLKWHSQDDNGWTAWDTSSASDSDKRLRTFCSTCPEKRRTPQVTSRNQTRKIGQDRFISVLSSEPQSG